MSVFIGADNFEKRTLPSGYTQLEYIQSSGTQYIDTGFKQTSEKMKIECDILIPSWVNDVCLFGTQNGTSSLDFSITCGTASGNACNFFVGTKLNVLSLNMATGTEHNLICEANNGTLTVTLDGSTTTGSYTGSLNKTLPFAIFGNNTNGSIGQLSSYRLKKFKIYDNGALVRDFVPCKNSSGTIGLIDLVNSAFYANAGSGTFTAGSANVGGVSREVDEIWLGESTAYASFTQPTLTANGDLGGTSFAVYASNVYTGYEAWRAFSSDTSAVYSSAINPSVIPVYYTIYNPYPIRITKLTFTNVPSALTSSSPSAGTIQGSNNGSSWKTIASFTNSNNTNGSTWSVSLTNSGFYEYYRIDITGANTTQAYVNIGKIKITTSQTTSGSVAREVDAGYIGESGIARQFWGGNTSIGDLEAGTLVYMKVNGVSKEFIVIQQGLPSSEYDSSCNGTWLLMKDIYTTTTWASSGTSFIADNLINCTEDFINTLDTAIQNIVITAKIPEYYHTSGSTVALTQRSLKAFALSYDEVGLSGNSQVTTEGSVLEYFVGATNATRYAYYNGTITGWWLRSARKTSVGSAVLVGNGTTPAMLIPVTNSYGTRPALILPSDTLIDDIFNVIA